MDEDELNGTENEGGETPATDGGETPATDGGATTYASVADVAARLGREMSASEESACSVLLEDAAVMIDSVAPDASEAAKKIVSCRMVIRALPGDGSSQVPVGATQGSMSALGYSQSWTFGSVGGTGELYLGKSDRQLLGLGNSIGSRSPTENLVPQEVTP